MILDKFSLQGKVAVVTGGGQGLGKVFCLAYAEAGADVVVAELNPQTGQQTAREVQALGRRSIYIPTDVRQRASVYAMFDQAVQALGRVDILMNNAGITKWCPAEQVSEEEWRQVIDVNLNGVFFACQAAAKHMIERGGGGVITNIASMSGIIVNYPQEQASYNTSKAAVIHLTKSLAAEWAEYGIRVNAIAPGYMGTAMTQSFFDDPKYGGVWIPAIPLKRPGSPEELGPLAVYLASEASSYMTGSIVVIDGGYTIW